MEKIIEFKTTDKKIIYSYLNYKFKSKKLIILIHGLGDSNFSHLIYNAAYYFVEEGFDVLRPRLYGSSFNERKLSECSIKTHANDIDLILMWAKENYKEVYLVGHSLGGPSILLSKNKTFAKKIAYLDPTFLSKSSFSAASTAKYVGEIDKFLVDLNVQIVVSKELIEEYNSFDVLEISRNLDIPQFFVMAQNSRSKEPVNLVLRDNKLAKSVEISNADHMFLYEDCAKEAYERINEFLGE